jgi:hypothetical protein
MRARAVTFAARWKDETSERGQSQSFWTEFLDIYGVDRKRVAAFEQLAKRTSTGNYGFIDLYWPGVLIAEQKSAGKDLEEAEQQALDYLTEIKQSDFPGLVITSDFARIRILDLEAKDPKPVEIKTADLGKEYERFLFIAGYAKQIFEQEIEANVEASELMGQLYDAAEAAGYKDHEANVLLTRLLFLMFGDDTAMWARGLFYSFVHDRTSDDASDLGAQLAMLFQVLNTPEAERPKNLDQSLADFPYVNGGLFSENLRIAAFTSEMRHALIKAMRFGWASISPAVFGSLFQSVKSKELRRELGEHYTPEKTIMKVIGPLFLDELKERLVAAKGSPQKLRNLRKELSTYNFLDPACGCGNFLIVAYREMRRMELETLKQLRDLKEDNQLSLDPTLGLQVSIDQFSGIEIEEWPAKVAETAMFLVDHQMNLELAEVFGMTPDRLPIKKMLNVRCANALSIDWREIVRTSDRLIILGNPPFLGSRLQTSAQKNDLVGAWGDVQNVKTLDYVTAWYAKAATFTSGTNARTGFISTNSVSQGEQASIIWRELNKLGFEMFFAHRTFAWSSDAPGAADVHCVIEGFSQDKSIRKQLFDYPDPKGDYVLINAKYINAYLQDAPQVLLARVSSPISLSAPELKSGNVPRDGGYLSDISDEEASAIRQDDPVAARYLRRIYGSIEHLQGVKRWCFWLDGVTPEEIRSSPELNDRVSKVKAERSGAAGSKGTAADRPSLFADIHQPTSRFLLVPSVSSFARRYIPLSFYEPENIVTNAVFYIENASLYEFGVLQSAPFVLWSRTVSSRLNINFQLSSTFTYNNYPWPEVEAPTHASIEAAAQNVLDARDAHPGSSLADLYDAVAMPPDLAKSHENLDKAVLSAYGLSLSSSDEDVLGMLFGRYAALTNSILDEEPKSAKATRKRSDV